MAICPQDMDQQNAETSKRARHQHFDDWKRRNLGTARLRANSSAEHADRGIINLFPVVLSVADLLLKFILFPFRWMVVTA